MSEAQKPSKYKVSGKKSGEYGLSVQIDRNTLDEVNSLLCHRLNENAF